MHLSKQALQEDINQLIHLLIESHPDPYSAGGGPLAFHRHVSQILEVLPEEGLDVEQFLRLLRPLVASIQDGHTWIGASASSQLLQPRPWLGWDAVEQQLYLSTVYRHEDEVWLGARLKALEGVPFEELLSRISQIRGCDNEYQKLVHLASAFADPALLADVLMQDDLSLPIHLTLLQPDGTQHEVTLPVSEKPLGPAVKPISTVSLPDMSIAQLGWSFLDRGRRIAYLRATSMMHYREAFEFSYKLGNKSHLDYHLDGTLLQTFQAPLPESIEDRIAMLPSATDLLRELFEAMHQAKSAYLIVDVRHNPGGNSLFASMLEYFLYGVEGIIAADDGYQVKRYSPLYFENRQHESREQFQEALQNGGYDFSDEQAWQQRQQESMTAEDQESIYQLYRQNFSFMPTFASIFEQRQYEAIWTPQVLVLTSADTYSAGFDMAVALLRHGAELIGVPSAQAGNCFIDALYYRLKHSDLGGSISFKRSWSFPNDPERGKLLRPVLELTYDYLKDQQFDPNATVKLALEYIADQ
ncbi:MAG: S41 family peptidase [Ktedonobacteraceae bacterium]